MNKSNLMSKAHKIAKTLIGNYAARLSMALKMVWAEIKRGVKMVELKGTEKQIKYANDIRNGLTELLNKVTKADMSEFKAEKIERQLNNLNEFRAEIENIDSAKYIIENFEFAAYQKGNESDFESIKEWFKSADRKCSFGIMLSEATRQMRDKNFREQWLS